jgi:hypothetical protein
VSVRPQQQKLDPTSWSEQPQGTLGPRELQLLANRLRDLPMGIRTVRIDLRNVRHLDFRGIPPLRSRIRSLRDRGIEVRCHNSDAYLATILRYALAEEYEHLTSCAGGEVLPLAEDRGVGIGKGVPHAPILRISRN